MGITRVANVTGLDRVGRARGHRRAGPTPARSAVSQGKGLTLAAAKVSAIMEAAELYHAETDFRPAVVGAARRAAAASGRSLDPLALPRSRSAPDYDGPLAWIEGLDLGRGGRSWCPFACVSADYTPAGRARSVAGSSLTTSGLGAGQRPRRGRCCRA